MSFFRTENLSIAFGGIRAVDSVSFDVSKGEIFTIIGPNGAGKTTIFNLISRIYDPTEGKITMADQDITEVPPHRIAGMGIARTFQNIELFEHASVLQNLLIGRHCHRQSRAEHQCRGRAVVHPGLYTGQRRLGTCLAA